MPSFYTLRMQFGPHQEPSTITDQLERLAQEGCVDEFMFFFFGEEQNDGHDTIPQVQNWIEQSRPYREALKKNGISISLNPWHSLLHCDRGRSLKPGQDWQQMVDPNGQEASAVVCFLDPAWQAYFFETLRMYAKEGFRVVWIDDDIRYHNHAPLEWGGCFCPLHVAEFNRSSGANAGRSEIVQACLQPGAPHLWRSIWLDMWQETILAFLGKCQSILDGSGTKMGLMSSSMESHAAEGRRWGDWWQTFGGGQPPVHRPHFWTYSDATSQMLIHGIAALDQNRSIHPDELESGPEIENFPYGRWNKSFRQTFAQMAVAHILGSTNLNISLYDFMGNFPDDEPERAVFLRGARPNLDWLADQFPMTMKSVGVGIPWSEDIGRMLQTQQGKSWFELQASGRGWSYWLGAAGMAFSARAQAGVIAIAGQAAWCIDGETMQRYLSTGVLLDGSAASILVERGFGKWIGITHCRQITQMDALYSVEECCDPRFSLRPGGQISINDRPHTQRMLQANLDSKVEIASNLLNPRQHRIGHGAFTFTNELGGKVAVVPWDAGAEPVMDIHRATQLRRLVYWLAGDQVMGSVEGGAWLLAQFLNDGENWRGVVWNAGPDEVDVVSISRPSGMPSIQHAWHLTWNGVRHEVEVDGDTLRLAQPLHEWDLVVFF